jgi:dienelactone hydrolase
MAEVLVFHHALGQTPGFVAFADELRRAGHTVHTPGLYDGRTFDNLDEGLALAREISASSSSAGCVPRTDSRTSSSTPASRSG